MKFHLDKSHPFIGKTLKVIVLPPELLVVLIIRGKELLVPNGGTILEQGDLLIAAAEEFEDRRNMTLQEVTVDKNYKWERKISSRNYSSRGDADRYDPKGHFYHYPGRRYKGLRGRCACAGKVLRQDILPFCVFRNSFIFI